MTFSGHTREAHWHVWQRQNERKKIYTVLKQCWRYENSTRDQDKQQPDENYHRWLADTRIIDEHLSIFSFVRSFCVLKIKYEPFIDNNWRTIRQCQIFYWENIYKTFVHLKKKAHLVRKSAHHWNFFFSVATFLSISLSLCFINSLEVVEVAIKTWKAFFILLNNLCEKNPLCFSS